jgi:hypothetical protein
MNFENIYASAIIGLCLVIAANIVDIKVTVNVTDKPIVNSIGAVETMNDISRK